MDDTDQSLSIKLYDVMDQVGVSERIRKLFQYTAITKEIMGIIGNQIIDSPNVLYIFGSNYEGTTTFGLKSETNAVHCIENVPVIDDIHAAPRGMSYIMVRDNHTYPGYVKLQLVLEGIPMTKSNTQLNDQHDTDTEGRVLKKSYTWIEPSDLVREIHGPAVVENEVIKACNYAHALRCRTMPICAREWLNRRRRYLWPSRGNLQKMGDMGCFVFGIGHSSTCSRAQDLEWRLSFPLQERLLMFSLNPTQHKCYVLLKLIKNEIIKADIGECITSYHCKTCLFYAIENTQAELWRPDNLVCCVRLCLMILSTCVVNSNCPNYFIPSEDMFKKPHFRANSNRLLELLRALLADPMSIILRLQCDNISNRILQPGILHDNMTDTIVYREYRHLYCLINLLFDELFNLANNSPVPYQNVLKLSHHIERLTNTRVIGEHTEQQTRDAISYVIPLLHLHIAQRLASLVCKGQRQEHARQLLYLSIHHYQHGNSADLMTSRLLVASFLLRLEKYDLCEMILKDIETDIKRYVVTECGCHDTNVEENADLMQYIVTNSITCKTAIRTVYVGCVRFARSDTEIAPSPLQYEMYRSMGSPPGSRDEIKDQWFDLAAVDGKVYLYFLQYLVNSRLNRPANKKIAFNNLYVSGKDSNLRHRETAYNLIGWIYVQEGHIPEALRCFMTSWKVRPIHNAAKWHLGLALYRMFTR